MSWPENKDHWDGKAERRMDYHNINERLGSIDVSLGVLTNKIENIHSAKNLSHEKIYESLAKYGEVIYGNGHEGLITKAKDISNIKKEIESHTIADRWFFGLLVTMNVGMLLKLFFG